MLLELQTWRLIRILAIHLEPLFIIFFFYGHFHRVVTSSDRSDVPLDLVHFSLLVHPPHEDCEDTGSQRAQKSHYTQLSELA